MKQYRLNMPLQLEAPERVADGAGGWTETWVSLGTLWGEIKPRTGRLANGETGAVSVSGVRITVRGAPEGQSDRPQAGQRFVMSTRQFRIEAVTEADPAARYLICHCEEEQTP